METAEPIMVVPILGVGWVTPIGADPATDFSRLDPRGPGQPGQPPLPLPRTVSSPSGTGGHRYLAVPDDLIAAVARHPRLRRASRLSLHAVTAALAAVRDAGLDPRTDLAPDRTALVCAVASGSAIYSSRFFEQIVAGGPAAASPLLFPETVYNAPASHLAAVLGLDGYCETLVGDAAVGLAALGRAAELLAADEADRALVVGTEEVDWAVCEAYGRWRLRPLFAEGAAALLLTRMSHTPATDPAKPSLCKTPRSGCAEDFCARRGVSEAHIGTEIRNERTTKPLRKRIKQTPARFCIETAKHLTAAAAQVPATGPLPALTALCPGVPFAGRHRAAAALATALEQVAAAGVTPAAAPSGPVGLVVASANGTFIDPLEDRLLAANFPAVPVLRPKRTLGEALGAGALMQTVAATVAIRRGLAGRALISVLGLNHQAAAAIVAAG